SQNCAERKAALKTVGLLRPPFLPPTPTETARLSVPPFMTLWQELQETVPSRESLGSKKSCRPRRILASDIGLSLGTGADSGRGSIAETAGTAGAAVART